MNAANVTTAPGAVVVIPARDLDVSEAFYARLGFRRTPGTDEFAAGYRILQDDKGGRLHLRLASDELAGADANPCGFYLYADDVDALAAGLREAIIGGDGPSDKDWGMYEFAVSDPDGALVRIGRPSRTPA